MKTVVYYCVPYSEPLEQVLKMEKIQYKTENFGIVQSDGLLSFTVEKDSMEFKAVIHKLDLLGLKEKGHASLRFTNKELDDAEWLHVRTTCMKVDTDVDQLSFAACGNPIKGQCFARHRISPIYCDKKVNWGNWHFFYAAFYYGYNELFCSEKAKDLLQKGDFPLAYEVLLKIKPSKEILPNVYHIISCNTLPLEAIETEHLRLQSDCPYCGKRTYELKDDVQLTVKGCYLHENAVIYATPSIWGPGWASSACIISQKGRQYLMEQRIDRGLRFTPVIVK